MFLEAVTNPKFIILILFTFIMNWMHSGYDMEKPKLAGKNYQMDDSKICLLSLLDKYLLYYRIVSIFGTFYVIYDTYVNNTRLSFANLFGLFLCSASYVIRNMVTKLMKSQYSFAPTILEEHKLITVGPYQYVRHPAYSSSIVRITGYIIMFDCNFIIFILGIIVIIAQMQSIKIEESLLVRRFGKEYKQYMTNVPRRLFPGIY